jgi:type II secretion system protein I
LKGFTLVELLVAVSILAVGAVGVLRSFLGAMSVLDHVNNRLSAVLVLDEKAGLFLIDSYFKSAENGDELAVTINGRKAVLHSSVVAWEEAVGEGLDRVTLSIVWKERSVIKDETIVFLQQSKT